VAKDHRAAGPVFDPPSAGFLGCAALRHRDRMQKGLSASGAKEYNRI
jgi:hypothetical protein